MTKFFLTPGIGNQFFQLVAAASCAQKKHSTANVVISKHYLKSKHGGVLISDFPFITNVKIGFANRLENIVYFFWQRFGDLGIIRWVFKLFKVMIEKPAHNLNQESPPDLNKFKAYSLACGYWQDILPEVILKRLGHLIDIAKLKAFLVQHRISSRNRIHIRAGDYKSSGIYSMLNEDYYIGCMSAVSLNNRSHEPWEVVTDDPLDDRVMKIFLALKNGGFYLDDMVKKSVMEDFLRLISAGTLVCANSTFSISAAHIRDLCGLGDGNTFVPNDWFGACQLKRPNFYSHHWFIR
jgi:hypothetical protein